MHWIDAGKLQHMLNVLTKLKLISNAGVKGIFARKEDLYGEVKSIRHGKFTGYTDDDVETEDGEHVPTWRDIRGTVHTLKQVLCVKG